jgi:hypothetical protein
LFDELRRQGFIAGQNLWVDERDYSLHVDQLADAAEFVKGKVDIIYCGGDPNVRAAQQATQTILTGQNGEAIRQVQRIGTLVCQPRGAERLA